MVEYSTFVSWKNVLKTVLTGANFSKIKDIGYGDWWKIKLLLEDFHRLGRDKAVFNRIFPLLYEKLELRQKEIETLHRLEEGLKRNSLLPEIQSVLKERKEFKLKEVL